MSIIHIELANIHEGLDEQVSAFGTSSNSFSSWNTKSMQSMGPLSRALGTHIGPSIFPHGIGWDGKVRMPEEQSSQTKITRISDIYHFEKSPIRTQDIITMGAKDEALVDLPLRVAVPITQKFPEVRHNIYQPN